MDIICGVTFNILNLLIIALFSTSILYFIKCPDEVIIFGLGIYDTMQYILPHVVSLLLAAGKMYGTYEKST